MATAVSRVSPGVWVWKIGRSKNDEMIICTPPMLTEKNSRELALRIARILQRPGVFEATTKQGYLGIEIRSQGVLSGRWDVTPYEIDSCWNRLIRCLPSVQISFC